MGSKKVVFTLNGLMFGGVARNTINLANHMAKEGHDISILLFGRRRDLETEIDKTVKVRTMGRDYRFSFFPFLFYLLLERPDLVISAKDEVNVFVTLVHRLSFIPGRCVITIRTTLSQQMKYSPTKRSNLTMLLAKRVYRWADTVVAVSRGTARDAERFLNLPDNSIRTIYNPAAKPSAFHEDFPLPGHPFFQPQPVTGKRAPVVLACGRYHLQKNFEGLIRSFAQVVREHDARLIILGEGGLQNDLQDLIDKLHLQEFVSLRSPVLQPEAYMNHAEVFVLNSLWEGFSNVLVEALSVGSAIVSVDCPHGPSEVLEGGKYGKLVPINDPEAMSQAIIDALKNKRQVKPEELLSRAADFTPAVIAAQYLALHSQPSKDR